MLPHPIHACSKVVRDQSLFIREEEDFWRGMGDHSVFRENEERSVVAYRGLNESGWDEWGSLELLL